MNYLKLMSILHEADADEYKEKKSKKKDEKDDFHRSKADQEFKDMHKVDTTTEDEYEASHTSVPTKHVGDHKGNPSETDVFEPKTYKSELKKYDMGGWGKSSKRSIDKTQGDKKMPSVKG